MPSSPTRCNSCEGCRWQGRCESWPIEAEPFSGGGRWTRDEWGAWVRLPPTVVKPSAPVAPTVTVPAEHRTTDEPIADPDLSDRDVARLLAALLRRLARRAERNHH